MTERDRNGWKNRDLQLAILASGGVWLVIAVPKAAAPFVPKPAAALLVLAAAVIALGLAVIALRAVLRFRRWNRSFAR
jgi:hypothetical protein